MREAIVNRLTRFHGHFLFCMASEFTAYFVVSIEAFCCLIT